VEPGGGSGGVVRKGGVSDGAGSEGGFEDGWYVFCKGTSKSSTCWAHRSTISLSDSRLTMLLSFHNWFFCPPISQSFTLTPLRSLAFHI